MTKPHRGQSRRKANKRQLGYDPTGHPLTTALRKASR